jgi:hypothetical protein
MKFDDLLTLSHLQVYLLLNDGQYKKYFKVKIYFPIHSTFQLLVALQKNYFVIV